MDLSIIGPMNKQIPGNKGLTSHNDVIEIDPDIVKIPLRLGNAKIECLVKEGDYVRIGDMIGLRNDRSYVPIFSSVSGKVLGIEKGMSLALKPCDHVVIESDHLDTMAEPIVLKDESHDSIIEFMKALGLCGQGGAGYPVYAKYSTDKCTTLVVNAVECEPLVTSDNKNIDTQPEDLKRGLDLMMKCSGCSKCYIGIKAYREDEIKMLRELFADNPIVEVVPCKDVYPMGWNRALVYYCTHQRYDAHTIDIGVLVSNITSAIALGNSLRTGMPIYKKMVTVSGDGVKEPHNVLCRVGTSFKEMVEACGGYTADRVSLIAGGPMMGTNLTKDTVYQDSINKAVSVLKYREYSPIKCLRCGSCVEHCPSGLEPCNILQAHKTGDFERLEKLKVRDCIECGMCSYVCPSKIEVTEGMRRAYRAWDMRRKK